MKVKVKVKEEGGRLTDRSFLLRLLLPRRKISTSWSLSISGRFADRYVAFLSYRGWVLCLRLALEFEMV
jgi:hypothetical protein